VPTSKSQATSDIADRASGFGMRTEIVDGNDVVAVRAASEAAVAYAREGSGPAFIECKTVRWERHSAFSAGGTDQDAARAASLATALSFRLKLALAAGFSPELASCTRCGEAEHLVGFSGAAGGVVCGACEAGSFPLSEEAHRFMVDAIARPLAEAPGAGEQELRQAERAVGETLEHHAHVQLRSAA